MLTFWTLVILAALISIWRYKVRGRSRTKKIESATAHDFNKRVVRPKRKGRTAEERKADTAHYHSELRNSAQQAFQRDKENALRAGSKKYIWRSSSDTDVCAVCSKNNGKRFSWNQAMPHGHAGECDVCPSGYCRCYAEAVL